jgi:P-type Ca2+ transporter type 2C
MAGKVIGMENLSGLLPQEIPLLQRQYGKNRLHPGASHRLARILLDIFREPMFILLVIACSLYFILGEVSEGVLMAIAMVIVTAISLYQEVKSSRALEALQQLTEPRVTVIRNGQKEVISDEDLLPGDVMLLEEGMKIPADALIIQSNDLSMNESIITGESLPVEKSIDQNVLYQGTTINSGKCIAKVTAIGNKTVLGKIGTAVSGYHPSKTLLQLQINKFVRRLALFGLAGFFIIFLVNYLHYRQFATSLLFALTLAMSAVPEEIPVAFSSFMALGAYKLSKLGIISRQPQIIENLGAINVLCLDKTGTITENKMKVKAIYDFKADAIIDFDENKTPRDILYHAMLASESDPFDAMEKAIWEAYNISGDTRHKKIRMVYEYPLEGRPPMMTHVYEIESKTIAAAKGGAERIISVCKLDEHVRKKVSQYVHELANNGYRVLGVASSIHTHSSFPESQNDFNWHFEGLVALYDPPRKNIPLVLRMIQDAKINVKIITGDYPETAVNIAQKVGIIKPSRYYTGEEVMAMSDDELKMTAQETNVFARMYPDVKLKLINALQAGGKIVAMTGDGVNDGPALKAASIGIAMGKKGTEIARQASDLILTDDNLEKVVTSVREGRKIYNNLLKAIRYIISIHIPIILTASLPVAFGWMYPNIFTPIHVIFLELIMGPTCSIFFEREPAEQDNMRLGPRQKTGLFTTEELLISITQGVVITTAVLMLYYFFMDNGYKIEEVRTIVFTTLILSNVFLTFTNRSLTKTIYYTSRYKNNLAPIIIIVSIVFLLLLHLIPAIRDLFQLTSITMRDFWICFGVAFASTMWFEVYKMDLWR